MNTQTHTCEYILTYIQRCIQTHGQRHTDTHTHTHTHTGCPTSILLPSVFSATAPTLPARCFGAGPAHLGKQSGRTHYHACSQFFVGLPPRSLYPNMSPDMSGLSSSGKGGVATSQGLGAGSLGLSQEASLGSLGMRKADLIWVPSRFSGKANTPPPLFPQIIISSSLWNQPIQAEAIWLQTGAPRRA